MDKAKRRELGRLLDVARGLPPRERLKVASSLLWVDDDLGDAHVDTILLMMRRLCEGMPRAIAEALDREPRWLASEAGAVAGEGVRGAGFAVWACLLGRGKEESDAGSLADEAGKKEFAKEVNAVCRAFGLSLLHPADPPGARCTLIVINDDYGGKFALHDRATKKRTHTTRDVTKILSEAGLVPTAPFRFPDSHDDE